MLEMITLAWPNDIEYGLKINNFENDWTGFKTFKLKKWHDSIDFQNVETEK